MKAKILSIAAAVLMIAVILAALPLTIPKLFGIHIFNLITPSMEPAMPVGSAVYVAPCSPESLLPGDVVAYYPGDESDVVQTHRITQNDTQLQQLVTKGDANADMDIDPVPYDRVVGKVVFSIPVLGSLPRLHSGGGIAVCIAIFAMAFILWTLADKMKERESFK